MHQKITLSIEFVLFFVVLPMLFAILPELGFEPRMNFILVAGSILLGLIYIIYTLFKKTKIRFRIKKGIQWSHFWKRTAITFLIIAVVTGLYVYFIDASALFCVPRTDMDLYIKILFIYTFLSVWPQEVIYRTFFFERFGQLFKDERIAILVGAFVFSLAHLLLRNALVLVLTFIGGLLFGYTYVKTRSTTLVSIEHALYGNWLFTVGMGKILAFPGMDNC